MIIDLSKTGVVVLAAGRGTRLGCVDQPKVMLPIGGKPVIHYIVETLQEIGFQKENIMMVVGFQKEKVMEYLGSKASYALQEPQKGTAHAAYVGIRALPVEVENVLVIQGDDSAFYKPETLKNFIQSHVAGNFVLSLFSVRVDNPAQLGRIVRHLDNGIEIIEKEYVTDEQKKINEVSTGTFCFNRNWYERMYPTMPPLRKLGEYGLPTALAVARETNKAYQVVPLEDNNEWYGINTPEELREADKRKNEIKNKRFKSLLKKIK